MASFNINFPGSAGDFVVSANNTIKTKGGIFTGDQKAGTFSLKTLIGSVKGNYQVLPATGTATEVAITITQKPVLVPLSKIKQVIEGYF
jgi:plastocyanin domain-containing protein